MPQVVLVAALMSLGSVQCHPITWGRGRGAGGSACSRTSHRAAKRLQWKLKLPPLPNSQGDARGCGLTRFDQQMPLGMCWLGAACTPPAAQRPRSHQPEFGSL